jgi:prolyl-tRNA editing enzyme YbaK/EbsC (Cys-tRNA(Pro) deacylase)
MEQLPIETVLQQAGISFRLVRLPENVFTVADVKNHLDGDLQVEEICKTIIIAGKKSGRAVAIFLRGDDKLDFKKAKQLCGEEMTIATAEQVKAASGVEPGAVCPFLLTVPLYA